MSTRTFDAKPARRERTPIIMGLVSPSGAGKTKSSLRLADGFSRVTPGPIVVIDTEAGRAKHHSDAHKFLHIDFEPPFGPLDYIDAYIEALKHKPTTIIVDQISYEWEGAGGVLEQHEAELDRMAGQDWKKRERCTMAAWIRPKADHNKMKQFIVQQRVNWIFCFRAKEKIKPQKGGEPLDLGWQAIGAEDLIYECLLKCLLFPGADGKPTWRSDKIGEQALMKLPGWFRDLFSTPRQLDEDIGEQLARWASGGDAAVPASSTASRGTSTPARPSLAARLDACTTSAELEALQAEAREMWKRLSAADRKLVGEAGSRATARIAAAPQAGELSDEEKAAILREEAANS